MSFGLMTAIQRHLRRTGLPFALVFLCSSGFSADSESDFFEKSVRPILVERCQSCHSAASGKTKGGLALDSREGWTKGGDSGSPIIPGNPDDSLLIRAIRYASDGPQMPPKDKGGKLPESEIAALTQWIAAGAIDPRTATTRVSGMTAEEARTWWSFQPLKEGAIPTVQATSWPQGDIDRFILAELEKRNIPTADQADRRSLIRRATLDLTGLPPTIEEIENFLSDSATGAFERVVNRLLASPAYGRTWARHWLDVVRYADFHDANPKARTASCEITEAWRFRDWVVDSLNSDMPFDEFIRHQIAGDLLPSPRGEEIYPEGLIATTFLSNGVWDRGDADKEKIISDMVDDNIDTVGKAFLGLTIGCARCHDHKFDPISTEDYYALAGIFYSSHILKELGIKGGEYTVNRVPLVPKEVITKRQQQEELLKETQARIATIDQQQRYLDLVAGGTALIPKEFTSSAGARAVFESDGSVVVDGPNVKDSYTVQTIAPDQTSIRFVRLEALADSNLPSNGPGRAANGNFILNRFQLLYGPSLQESSPTEVKWISAKSDFDQKSFAVAGAIDDKPETGWAIDPATGVNHVAVFELDPSVAIPAGSPLSIVIHQTHSEGQTLGRFRISVASSLSPVTTVISDEKSKLVSIQKQLQDELATPLPLAMAVEEGGMPGGLFPNIQDVPIHIRGSYARLGPVVPRRMPKFLAGDNQPTITSGSGRRELANWVASKSNPLTARVIVNRIWQWHFGEGLVRTPSNFGKLGEQPTHPALLDWLARGFMDEGWSLKKLHKQILLSSTYQLSSRAGQEQIHLDPENKWLSRFLPRRLSAEAIRDVMLFVSGQLDASAGGSADDDFTSRRRSLYVQTARWDRSSYAMLFDAANPDSSTEKRTTSTVAPQALLFLNHDFVLKQAGHLAERLAKESKSDDVPRIHQAFQLLYGRLASSAEIEISRKIINATGKQSGWTDLAHVLFCSNEFVYLD